jgi:hypothetical protein
VCHLSLACCSTRCARPMQPHKPPLWLHSGRHAARDGRNTGVASATGLRFTIWPMWRGCSGLPRKTYTGHGSCCLRPDLCFLLHHVSAPFSLPSFLSLISPPPCAVNVEYTSAPGLCVSQHIGLFCQKCSMLRALARGSNPQVQAAKRPRSHTSHRGFSHGGCLPRHSGWFLSTHPKSKPVP